MSVTVPAQAYADAMAADPGLAPLLLAIAANESSYNPHALGDYDLGAAGPTSYGYLQFHQHGGLGDGHSVEELLDGQSNMRLGAATIRGKLNAGLSVWDALQPWSTRPADYALYQRMQAEGLQVGGQAVTPVLAADAVPEAPSTAASGLPRGALTLGLLALAVLVLGDF